MISMKKKLFIFLVFLSLFVLVMRFGSNFTDKILSPSQIAGLKITTAPGASVLIDGIEVGQTPYLNEKLKPQSYLIKLVANSASWQGLITLSEKTLSVINRELTENIASSSGEILTLSSGNGINIISTPSNAEVSVDGKICGVTPLLIPAIDPGEHEFLISHKGYLKRNIKAVLPENMILNLEVNLAVADLNIEPSSTNLPVPPVIKPKVLIKKTPTGFLRVRSNPSLKAAEITRIASNESLDLLEELPGWYKVKLENGQEGYISSSYAQKIN